MLIIRGFDWDDHNINKIIRHKVVQDEAEDIFYIAPFIDKEAYSKEGETRYRCLGVTATRRHLTAIFTIRKGLIQNISVRAMSKKEKAVYEKAKGR